METRSIPRPMQGQLIRQSVASLVMAKVQNERGRQDAKFGRVPRDISWGTWLGVLGEEFGEVCKEVIEHDNGEKLVAELSHVAAVALAWMEDLTVRKIVEENNDYGSPAMRAGLDYLREIRDEPVDGGGSPIR